MRPVKTVGLAIVGALVAAALFSAASASAVTMCTANTAEECPAGKRIAAREYKTTIPGGTEAIINTYQNTVFKSQIKCTKSRIFFETSSMSASPLAGTVKFFELSSCEQCKKSSVVNLSYKFGITSFAPPGTTNGNLEAVNGGGGGPIFLFEECGINICKYAATEEKMNFKVSGGEPAKLEAVSVPFQYSGGSGEVFCGDEAFFTATYNFSEPATKVYVTAKP